MCGTFFGRGLCRQNPRGGWSLQYGVWSVGYGLLDDDDAAGGVVDRRRLCSRLATAF